jgi:hypothetical protein
MEVMFLDILVLVVFLVLGIVIGHSGMLPRIVTNSMDWILMLVIYILLLFVGIEVGTYKEVLQNLDVIGFKAVLLCIGSIAGSGLLCMAVMKRG